MLYFINILCYIYHTYIYIYIYIYIYLYIYILMNLHRYYLLAAYCDPPPFLLGG